MAHVGGFFVESGPLTQKATLTFFDCPEHAWPGTWYSSSHGLWMADWDTWHAGWVRFMVEYWTGAALERIRKKVNNYMGDLGIEPRSQCSSLQCLCQLNYDARLLNKWITNIIYKKQILWCKTKITRAKFECPNHVLTPIIFFLVFL